MTNLDRLRRQVMSDKEAAKAATELAFLRSDMLRVARIAKTGGFKAILGVRSVHNALEATGEGGGHGGTRG